MASIWLLDLWMDLLKYGTSLLEKSERSVNLYCELCIYICSCVYRLCRFIHRLHVFCVSDRIWSIKLRITSWWWMTRCCACLSVGTQRWWPQDPRMARLRSFTHYIQIGQIIKHSVLIDNLFNTEVSKPWPTDQSWPLKPFNLLNFKIPGSPSGRYSSDFGNLKMYLTSPNKIR